MDNKKDKRIRKVSGNWRGDTKLADIKHKRQDGVTKKEFFAILDKASQPINREAESDSEKSQT